MSNQLLTKVQADRRTSGATRLVLFVLADMANEQGECWPSYQTIAERAGIDVRTAYRAVSKLEKLGFLFIIRRPDPGKNKNLSNLYRVTVSVEGGGMKSPAHDASIESTVDTLTSQNDHTPESCVILATGQGNTGIMPGGIMAASQDGTGNTPGGIMAGCQGGTDSESPKSLINPHFNQPPPLQRKPGGQDIFSLYEQNFGLITPMTAELLMDAEKTYPLEWIKAAMKECVRNNTRRWNYCQAILERYRRDGFTDGTRKKPPAGKKPGVSFSERMMRWAEEQEAAHAARLKNKLLPSQSEGKAASNER